MKCLAAVAIVMLLLVACASPNPTTTPAELTPSPPASAATAEPSPTPSPTPPSETVLCVPDRGKLPAGLTADPCPTAIAAVRAIVTPLNLPIARIVVEPGPFFCGVIWPGIPTAQPVMCAGALIMPGLTMHAWVSFAGSPKVAAVGLGRSLPGPGSTATPDPRWTATLAAFQVPPTGWVMP